MIPLNSAVMAASEGFARAREEPNMLALWLQLGRDGERRVDRRGWGVYGRTRVGDGACLGTLRGSVDELMGAEMWGRKTKFQVEKKSRKCEWSSLSFVCELALFLQSRLSFVYTLIAHILWYWQ